jgi:CRP-like cAMP-binding protein
VRRYTKGEAIFGEGTPSEFFYTVAGGRAKVFKTTAWGRDVILEVRGPGAPLGAVALHEGLPFPFSAAALEDTTCVLVPRDAFFRLLEGYPSLARGLWLGLTEDLSELMDRTATLIGARAEPRFARLFLKMAADLGRKQRDGVFIGAPLSRQELADLTGTTIETCIRIMSRWKKRRIVRTEKSGFTVIAPKTLRALALE